MNVRHKLHPEASSLDLSAPPELDTATIGTLGYPRLRFDCTTDETAYWVVLLDGYCGGDILVDIYWAGIVDNTGVVKWEVSLGTTTPEIDEGYTDITFTTVATSLDAHLGSTAGRIMRAPVFITGAAREGVLKGDLTVIRIRRLGSDEEDTMDFYEDLQSDALLMLATVSY